MGRAENRKKMKSIKKRMTDEQFGQLNSEINRQYINDEVNSQICFYQKLWSDCIIEAFKKCGYTLDKAKIILDETESIMLKKVEAKKNGKS